MATLRDVENALAGRVNMPKPETRRSKKVTTTLKDVEDALGLHDRQREVTDLDELLEGLVEEDGVDTFNRAMQTLQKLDEDILFEYYSPEELKAVLTDTKFKVVVAGKGFAVIQLEDGSLFMIESLAPSSFARERAGGYIFTLS